jgi:hypothetical protein
MFPRWFARLRMQLRIWGDWLGGACEKREKVTMPFDMKKGVNCLTPHSDSSWGY